MKVQIRPRGPSVARLRFAPGLVGPVGPAGNLYAPNYKTFGAAASAMSLAAVLDESAIHLNGLLSAGTSPADAAANTAVINAATAAAKARGNRVPTIIPPGTWLIDFDTLIRDNAPIVGRKGLSTLKLRGGVQYGNGLRTENYTDKTNPTKNIHLEGFTLDVNGSAQIAGGSLRGIGIAYAAGMVMRDVTIKNVTDMGLWFIPEWTDYGTQGAYGGLANPPNRPFGDPWVSTDVLIERCLFDGRGNTSPLADFIILVGIRGLTVRDNVFWGTNRNTLGPEWCRDFLIEGNRFYDCASALYAETILHGAIRNNYFEGTRQLNQADWLSPLHNTAIWLATGDDTLGSPTVNQYSGCVDVEVAGNKVYNFSRPAPPAGNVQAGGIRGILVSGRNTAAPASLIRIHDNDLTSIQGLGYQAGRGGATAYGIGIETSGAVQDTSITENNIKSCDVGVRVGGPYPDNAATLGTITPSTDSHDTVSVQRNLIRDYAVGIMATGGHLGSRWDRNRFRAPRAGAAKVQETGLSGTWSGGLAAQIDEETGDAWTASTPAVVPLGTPGAFAATASVRAKQDGKTVAVQLAVTVTNMGAATGFAVNVPVTPRAGSVVTLVGAGASSGAIIVAYGGPGGTQISFYTAAGALAVQAQTYTVAGTYEAA